MVQTQTQKTIQRARRILVQRLRPAVVRDRIPLTVTAWQVPDEPVPFAYAVSRQFEPFAVGQSWGAPWSTTWFRLCGQVPTEWAEACGCGDWTDVSSDGCVVELHVDLGFDDGQPGFQGEGLVWRTDGTVVKGISPRNQSVSVAQSGPIDLYVEAAANPKVMDGEFFAPTPLGDKATGGDEPLYVLRAAEITRCDIAVWQLAQDFTAVIDLVGELPSDSARHVRLTRALDLACDALGADVCTGADNAREVLRPVLSLPASASATRQVAVGHAHIDSAWLWPERETIRKVARTFSNALDLIDSCPDFVFAASSAQQYQWVKDRYPDLFARIKKAVADGRWLPVGGMWVESDTNMPGGEAMARQFVLGKEFFLREFGVETLDAWLPDTFGYTASLPQIVRQAGARRFLSQKPSWNETDVMPHHTFWWQGIDGSRVLVHLPPADSYGTQASVSEACFSERNFSDKDVLDSSVLLYGWSDGGGGPTREMIASARRLKSLEGAPRVEFGTPDEVFAEAEAHGDQLATWAGEIYLELHRGTLTSLVDLKRGSRRCEHLAREAELWATTAAVRVGSPYPYERLETLWQDLLLHQFHDILPGSSIRWVNADAEQAFARVSEGMDEIASESLVSLVGFGGIELLANAGPKPRTGVGALTVEQPQRKHGHPARMERDETGVWLKNGALSVHVTPQGRFDSAVGADGREAIPTGMEANLLQIHDDRPRQWDAWDIDDNYRRMVADVVGTITEANQGNGTAQVVVEYTVGASAVRQTIELADASPYVTIRTDIDWHEHERLLKLAFPCDLLAPVSTSDIQFGHIDRPTHRNTGWDQARFEICAHRWIRVAEGDYGVAVANDSTYGHDVTTTLAPDGHPVTVMRDSLIRGPVFPDPQADQGHHTMTTLYHPQASLDDAITDGYEVNLPPRTVRGAHSVEPVVTVDGPGVVVECVKLAQDRSGDVIVRLYESLGSRTCARISARFECHRIVSTDLLERPDGVLEKDGSVVDLTMKPFEIVTLRFSRP